MMSITAPIDGEVLEITAELGIPGSRITSSQTLFTVADPGSAIVELEVLEQYAGALQSGQSVVNVAQHS